ncbi:SH3 domain-containing protein [Leptospira venezuelensis]|uniref:SH3 domain-containing protein n=1 Tax=Leptospira venezuelensis TaxID=1958811 RepID=UPI000A366FA4|nr:SH3 domain-containing protein [Leptospira venezuelensis]
MRFSKNSHLILLMLFAFSVISILHCDKTTKLVKKPFQYVYAVSGSDVNLRANPGINQPIIEVMNNGLGLEILDSSMMTTREKYPNIDVLVPIYWYKVKTENGNIGYVSRQYVSLLFGQKKSGLIGIAEQLEKGKLNATVLSILQDGVPREPSTYDYIKSKVISRVPKKMPVDSGLVISSNQSRLGEIKGAKFATDYTKEPEPGCWEGHYFSGIYDGVKPTSKDLILLGIDDISKPSFEVTDITNQSIIKAIKELSSSKIKEKNPSEFTGRNFVCVSGDKCIYKSIKHNGFEYAISTQTVEYPDKSGHLQIFRIDKIIENRIENLYYTDSMGGKRDVPDRETVFAITDLDNNGILEIFTVTSGYEWWWYSIYSLEQDRVISVFRGAGGGC